MTERAMGFREAVSICFNNYVAFSGRARRSEYWWFFLFTMIASLIAGVLDSVLGFGGTSGPISLIASLGLLLPAVSVGSRRLHDIDRTAWWLLISIVPIVGFIVLLVFFIQRGTDGPNRFGRDPLAGFEGAQP